MADCDLCPPGPIMFPIINVKKSAPEFPESSGKKGDKAFPPRLPTVVAGVMPGRKPSGREPRSHETIIGVCRVMIPVRRLFCVFAGGTRFVRRSKRAPLVNLFRG